MRPGSLTTIVSIGFPHSSHERLVEMTTGDDYIWRFEVQPATESRGYDDPLVEMVRAFLDDFLSFGILTSNGARIQVDGFAFSNDPEQVYRISLDEVAAGVRPR